MRDQGGEEDGRQPQVGHGATPSGRVAGRRGHFMPASLVDNQFAILEPPAVDENTFSISAERPIDEIVAAVTEFLAIERLKSAE